jgi:CelD/BcsL family acetyltransferase involved in cellulose biosynthesis
MNDTFWNFYRDESERPLVDKVRDCRSEFRKKTGLTANVIAVSSAFPADAEHALAAEGIEVVHNQPAWCQAEIWIGWRQTNEEAMRELVNEISRYEAGLPFAGAQDAPRKPARASRPI